jgi:dihydroorotase
MTDRLTIRRPDDWHVHLRDGAMLNHVAQYTARQFARAIVMPNLSPPVTTAEEGIAYRDRINAAVPAELDFTPLIVAYLTDHSDADEMARGHAEGVFTAAKLYPAHATTGSAHGVTDIAKIMGVLERMQDIGMPLLIHGEVTDHDVDIFDREAVFIERTLEPLVRALPALKIVFEHITTAEAAQFVADAPANIAATITPQHLHINRNAMLVGGIRPHAYCLPVAKREHHRLAVRAAVPRARPNSSSAPTARRMRCTRKKIPAAARAFSTRPSRWKAMRCVRSGRRARQARRLCQRAWTELLWPAAQHRHGDARTRESDRP